MHGVNFGGSVAQFSHFAIVLDLSITGHAGIAADYDHRVRQMIQKAALTRSPNTDYFALLRTLSSDVRAAAIRDFDVRAESINKGEAKVEADKEKAKNSKDRDKKRWKKEEKRMEIGWPADALGGCTKADWAAWGNEKRMGNHPPQES